MGTNKKTDYLASEAADRGGPGPEDEVTDAAWARRVRQTILNRAGRRQNEAEAELVLVVEAAKTMAARMHDRMVALRDAKTCHTAATTANGMLTDLTNFLGGYLQRLTDAATLGERAAGAREALSELNP